MSDLLITHLTLSVEGMRHNITQALTASYTDSIKAIVDAEITEELLTARLRVTVQNAVRAEIDYQVKSIVSEVCRSATFKFNVDEAVKPLAAKAVVNELKDRADRAARSSF